MQPLGAYLLRTGEVLNLWLQIPVSRSGLGGRKCKPKNGIWSPKIRDFIKIKHPAFFKTIPSMNQMESIFSSLSCLLMDDREMGASVYQPNPSNTNGNLERRYLPGWGKIFRVLRIAALWRRFPSRFWAMLREFVKETGNQQLLYTSDFCLWF